MGLATEKTLQSLISGSSGSATSALQTAGNASLSSIDTSASSILTGLASLATSALQTSASVILAAIRDRLPPAIGLQTMANSLSIMIASDSPFGLANKPAAALSTPAQIVGNASAQQLASAACVSGCWVQVVSASTTSARIGDSNAAATRGREITVGDEKWFPVANTNLLYFYGAATCTIQVTIA